MPRAAVPSRRKSLRWLALAAVVIGGVWWWTGPPPEPVSRGLRLSKWVAADWDIDADRETRAAELASFGPAAIPWLVYMVENGKHSFVQRRPLPFDNAPEWLREYIPNRWGGLHESPAMNDERINALCALSLLEARAAPAIPTLARCLKSKDDDLTGRAVLTLYAIGPAALPALQHTIEHGDSLVALNILQEMDLWAGTDERPRPDSEAACAIELFRTAARVPQADMRRTAVEALARCCLQRSQTAPFKAAMLEFALPLADPDTEVRLATVHILENLGPKAAPAVPRLVALLDDNRHWLRAEAAWALSHIDTEEKRSAPRLRLMLEDEDPRCREAAAWALETFGLAPAASSADAPETPSR